MRFYNACVYGRNKRPVRNSVITIDKETGDIEDISVQPDYEPESGDFDCKGCVVMSSFMDSSVTLPGPEIFTIYGINLSSINDVDGYLQRIASYSIPKAGIRGFGINEHVAGQEGCERIKKMLDRVCPNLPAYIYFDDLTAVLVNDYVLEMAKDYFHVDKDTHADGVLNMQEMYELTYNTDIFKWAPDEIRIGLMAFQSKLMENGITDIRVVNVLGGHDVIEQVNTMSLNGMWNIETVVNVPIPGFVSEEKMWEIWNDYSKYSCDGVYVTGISIMLDGSIDSMQAALEEPYEVDKEWCGDIVWSLKKLNATVKAFSENDIDINIIAHGDRAVAMAADALLLVKSTSKSRCIITRAYLVSESAMMSSTGSNIIYCIEPNSVPYAGSFYDGDKEMLGDRIYQEYPIGRLMYAGIKVISGSNTPTNPEVSPIGGVYKASHRTNEDDVTPYRVLQSYQDVPREVFGLYHRVGDMEVGMPATFILVNKDVVNMREDLLCDCEYMATVVEGNVLWVSDKLGV